MTDETKEPKTISRLTVRMKPHDYQPKKAELEEPFQIRKSDGTMPTPEELARGALGPVTILEDLDA